MQAFLNVPIFQRNSFPSFSFHSFSAPTICLNSNLLLQAMVCCSFFLTIFWGMCGHFSVLTDFQLKQIKSRPLASFFQVAPRQVGTDKHNSLRMKSVLLSLEQETGVPFLECGILSSRLLPSQEGEFRNGN